MSLVLQIALGIVLGVILLLVLALLVGLAAEFGEEILKVVASLAGIGGLVWLLREIALIYADPVARPWIRGVVTAATALVVVLMVPYVVDQYYPSWVTRRFVSLLAGEQKGCNLVRSYPFAGEDELYERCPDCGRKFRMQKDASVFTGNSCWLFPRH